MIINILFNIYYISTLTNATAFMIFCMQYAILQYAAFCLPKPMVLHCKTYCFASQKHRFRGVIAVLLQGLFFFEIFLKNVWRYRGIFVSLHQERR